MRFKVSAHDFTDIFSYLKYHIIADKHNQSAKFQQRDKKTMYDKTDKKLSIKYTSSHYKIAILN